MVVIGFLMALICGMSAIAYLLEDKGLTAFILAIFTGLGVLLWVNDVNSPIEVTESYVLTNDLAKYNISVELDPLDEEKVFKVKVIDYDPTNYGAIWNERTKYKLVIED